MPTKQPKLFNSREVYQCDCGEKIKKLQGKNRPYDFVCQNCNFMGIQAKTLAEIENIRNNANYSYYDQKLIKWCLANDYLEAGEVISAANSRLAVNREIKNEFKESQDWDVVILGSGKPILCNEQISYKQAKRICNRDDTSFENSFAGFCLYGNYANTREGEPFDIL